MNGGFWGPKRVTQLVALVLAAAAAGMLLVLPTYTSVTTDSSGGETINASTLLEVNGPWALVPLLVPVVLALAPVLTRGRAWQPVSVVATVLLGVFVVLGMLTVGLFFAPAFVAALVGVLLAPRGGVQRSPASAGATP